MVSACCAFIEEEKKEPQTVDISKRDKTSLFVSRGVEMIHSFNKSLYRVACSDASRTSVFANVVYLILGQNTCNSHFPITVIAIMMIIIIMFQAEDQAVFEV